MPSGFSLITIMRFKDDDLLSDVSWRRCVHELLALASALPVSTVSAALDSEERKRHVG